MKENMSTKNETQRQKLAADLRNVIQDAEDLVKMTASDAGDEAVALRERLRVRLTQAKESLVNLQEVTVEHAKVAGRKADDYVHENPWQSVGVAAGVGVLVGLLIGRR